MHLLKSIIDYPVFILKDLMNLLTCRFVFWAFSYQMELDRRFSGSIYFVVHPNRVVFSSTESVFEIGLAAVLQFICDLKLK